MSDQGFPTDPPNPSMNFNANASNDPYEEHMMMPQHRMAYSMAQPRPSGMSENDPLAQIGPPQLDGQQYMQPASLRNSQDFPWNPLSHTQTIPTDQQSGDPLAFVPQINVPNSNPYPQEVISTRSAAFTQSVLRDSGYRTLTSTQTPSHCESAPILGSAPARSHAGALTQSDRLTQVVGSRITRPGRGVRRSLTSDQRSTTTTSKQPPPACAVCRLQSKTRDEARAHLHKHKIYRCTIGACARSDKTFPTINDLWRHRKGVHGETPEVGDQSNYECVLCTPSPDRVPKLWRRKDNFKAHLIQKHKLNKDIEATRLKQLIDDSRKDVTYPPGVPGETQAEVVQRGSENRSQTSSRGRRPANEGDHVLATHGFLDMHLLDMPMENNLTFATGHATSVAQLSDDTTNNFYGPQPPGVAQHHAHSYLQQVPPTLPNSFPQPSTMPLQPPNEHPDLRQQWNIRGQRQHLRATTTHAPVVPRSNVTLPRSSVSFPTDQSDRRLQRFYCDSCDVSTSRACDLTKHKKRHSRPYFCTSSTCTRSFGSLDDWRRHESSQHREEMDREIFKCARVRLDGTPCRAAPFKSARSLVEHLHGPIHGVKDIAKLKSLCKEFRLGRWAWFNFWCGFCRKIIRSTDSKPADGRVRHFGHHIDKEHSKIEQWVTVEYGKLKRDLTEEERHNAKEHVEPPESVERGFGKLESMTERDWLSDSESESPEDDTTYMKVDDSEALTSTSPAGHVDTGYDPAEFPEGLVDWAFWPTERHDDDDDDEDDKMLYQDLG